MTGGDVGHKKTTPSVPPGWRAEQSHWRPARWAIGALVFILGGVIGVSVPADSQANVAAPAAVQAMPTVTSIVTATAVVTVEPPKPLQSGPAAEVSDGVHLVGEDLQPGVYTTDGAGGATCYWARLKNAGGGPAEGVGAIIDNHLGSGRSTFTAKKGEFVQVERCTYKLKK